MPESIGSNIQDGAFFENNTHYSCNFLQLFCFASVTECSYAGEVHKHLRHVIEIKDNGIQKLVKRIKREVTTYCLSLKCMRLSHLE